MVVQAPSARVRADVAHLARRAGFGLHADDLDVLAADGYEAAEERVVRGLSSPDPAARDMAPTAYDTPRLLALSAQQRLLHSYTKPANDDQTKSDD